MSLVKNFTADELLRLPDDGFRYELIHGELRRMSPAGSKHGVVAMNIALSLGSHVRTHALGRVFAAETGFLLSQDPDHVRAPDSAFVRKERADEVGDTEKFWPGPPDLAVEVISPSDTYTDVEERVFD